MVISIADAVSYILAQPPVPVILVDTCSFIDLFRRDQTKPRVLAEEIQAAVDLMKLMTRDPAAAHLLVPELVPREYSDHADSEEKKFNDWTSLHDENQQWLVDAFSCVTPALPTPYWVHPLGLGARLRNLANDLLGKAIVLDRDQECLNRAVVRLVNKTRPSHKKEVKDSMNLEQSLELSRQLESAGFPKSRVWVSSNINDFAQDSKNPQLHTDLQGEFVAAGLRYFISFEAAIKRLSAESQIP